MISKNSYSSNRSQQWMNQRNGYTNRMSPNSRSWSWLDGEYEGCNVHIIYRPRQEIVGFSRVRTLVVNTCKIVRYQYCRHHDHPQFCHQLILHPIAPISSICNTHRMDTYTLTSSRLRLRTWVKPRLFDAAITLQARWALVEDCCRYLPWLGNASRITNIESRWDCVTYTPLVSPSKSQLHFL